MALTPDPDPPRNSFRVVCRGDDGHWFVIDQSAATAPEAFALAKSSGRTPRMVYPAGLPRLSEDRLLRAGREIGGSMTACITCGYSLKGLAPDSSTGLLICPECGVGALPWSPGLDAEPPLAVITRLDGPGCAYSTVGILLGLVGFFNLYFGGAALVLGAVALERSKGLRGQGAIVTGLIALLARLAMSYGAV